jgi:hypothetical protein
VAGCCECGDEPSGSDATELVSMHHPAKEYSGVEVSFALFTSELGESEW